MMESILAGIDDSNVYNDVGALSTSWELHIDALQMVLQHLKDDSFTGNLLKCEDAIKDMVWICYWFIPCGPKPRKRNLMQSCTWTVHEHPLTYAILSVVSIFVMTHGLAMHMF